MCASGGRVTGAVKRPAAAPAARETTPVAISFLRDVRPGGLSSDVPCLVTPAGGDAGSFAWEFWSAMTKCYMMLLSDRMSHVTRATYHHGALPRAVLDAALAQLAEGDRVALNINQIARTLGVSHAAVYRHFPSKQHVIDALAKWGFERLRAAQEAAIEALTSPQDRIHALGVAYVRFAQDQPVFMRLMFSGAAAGRHRDPELKAAAKATIALLGHEVRLASEHGYLPADEVHDATQGLWAAMHGLALLRIEGQLDYMSPSAADFDRLVGRTAAWLTRGIMPPG